MTPLTRLHALCAALFLSLVILVQASANESPKPEICAHGEYPPSKPSATKPGWFDVDLDVAPKLRWLHVFKRYEKELIDFKQGLVQKFNQLLIGQLPNHNLTLEKFYDLAFQRLPTDTQEEMRGVFETFPQIERNMLIIMNLLYELMTACTSVVARKSVDPNGSLVHGRNMDYYNILDDQSMELINAGMALWARTTKNTD